MTGPILVDAHMHVYPSRASGERAFDYEIWEYGDQPVGLASGKRAGDLGDLLTGMKTADLAHAVVLNMPPAPDSPAVPGEDWPEHAGMVASNLGFLAAMAKHPGLSPLVGIDPMILPTGDLLDHLSDCAHAGARGVKLHPVVHGYRPDDRRVDSLYATCSELDLVVLAHSGPARDPNHGADPGSFAGVIQRHPQLSLVLAHLGGGSWRTTLEFAHAFPTVAFDLCEIIEWSGAPGAPSREQLAQLIKSIGTDRVLFGSDFPWYEPGATIGRIDDLPGLGRTDKAEILGENAIRIFGLPL